jgi:hypothetical protein
MTELSTRISTLQPIRPALETGISDTRRIRVLANATKLCIVVCDGTRSNTGSIYLLLAPVFLRFVQGKPIETVSQNRGSWLHAGSISEA